MFLCWVKSSRALSFTRLLVSVQKRKKRAEKKRAGSAIGKERKTEGREKKRACKHLFKCLNAPTCRKTVSCVKTSKGALV